MSGKLIDLQIKLCEAGVDTPLTLEVVYGINTTKSGNYPDLVKQVSADWRAAPPVSCRIILSCVNTFPDILLQRFDYLIRLE